MEGLGMSLDEMISKKKSLRRRNQRRTNNGGRRTGTKLSSGLSTRNSNTRRNRDDGSKIMISNLEYKVTEKDLRELFNDIGPIRSVSLNYDQNGRSKGSGQVVFVRRGDAKRASDKYNKVTLDGRSMKIEIVLSSTASSAAASRNNRRGNGRNNGRRNNRFNKNKEPQKSAEQLDAEMDAYMNTDD
ncbi:RNA-binding domain-containing protein [Anaeromyces robustus]|uniref:RNA-binding domain-containing protein n=1 Tax=Anaeromyces robustus TaxID=1754192 RepID=A0A1Y1XEN3_9FUNG|nr:RNA-binding domain-containing protein [Anaeromyces robustus]|eukprot:ORX84218.1 RNA-binding domain-containing protein [Anaeromyces robustus]